MGIDYGTGFTERRWEDNPMEEKFAKAWVDHNKRGKTLQYLTSEGNDRSTSDMTDRDIEIAGKVIQWLGSPVGMCFLRDVLGKEIR